MTDVLRSRGLFDQIYVCMIFSMFNIIYTHIYIVDSTSSYYLGTRCALCQMSEIFLLSKKKIRNEVNIV